jgi:hypothetical protein
VEEIKIIEMEMRMKKVMGPEIPVASDRCAARCGHIRIMMYDVIPNVPTSLTYCNLMNKVKFVFPKQIFQKDILRI